MARQPGRHEPARADREQWQGPQQQFRARRDCWDPARRTGKNARHRSRRRLAYRSVGMSWLHRLRGGFTKTAERVADNLTGITSRAALDTATLDDVEEALIASDLGPEASHRIREAIARQKFERLDERGLRTILAEEIEKILTPVATPL